MFLIALSACSNDHADAADTQVLLIGSIDEAKVSDLAAEIKKHPAGKVVLEVQSTGGDSLQAMKLGDIMRERMVSLVIRKYCQSACAQYLIPSATSVKIEGNASVTFHGTPSWIVVPDDAPTSQQRFFADFKKREEAFLEERGIVYLNWPWVQYHKQPTCWFENMRAPSDRPDRYGTASRVHFVAPSREVFADLGMPPIHGTLPESAKEAYEIAIDAGFQRELLVAFVPKINIPEGWTPPILTECDDDQRAALGYD